MLYGLIVLMLVSYIYADRTLALFEDGKAEIVFLYNQINYGDEASNTTYLKFNKGP